MIKPNVIVTVEDETYVDERYGNYIENNKKARKKMYIRANKLKYIKVDIQPIINNDDDKGAFGFFLDSVISHMEDASCVPKEYL